MTLRQRLLPTTTGVSLSSLGASLVPLARNIASTRLPVLRARNPVFATWAVTEACNLACAHCSMNRPLPDELTHAQRLEMARRLAASDVWGVSLIGGEPLLVDGLFEYARILKAGGKRVFLGTSGDRLGRFVDPVFEAGLDVITISIEGADAEAHDAFRRRAGLFARIVEATDRIRARRPGDRPQLQVRCTINRLNFREIGEVIEFWRGHVDNVLVQVVQDNCLHQVRDRSCLFQPDDRPEFERVYADLRARYPFLAGAYYDLLPRFIFEPEALYADIGFRCLLVPATSIILEANGRVKLCHGRKDSDLGSLVESSLEDLWRSKRAAEARTTMQSRDYNCMCWESSYARNLDLVEMSRYYDLVRDGLGALAGAR
jgi:MoaA/NifB/PqqE/SkfB family radical SAM enzyme